VGDDYSLSADFETELRAAYSTPEVREVSQEDVQSVEASYLHITTEELEQMTDVVQPSTEFDRFDSKWDDQFKVTAGFGETLKWRGTEVWDGLTAEEIREDMDTAYPAGRAARRVHHRTLRNAFRRMAVKGSPESRKSIKVTGKVGV
jgi:hypothetical protein